MGGDALKPGDIVTVNMLGINRYFRILAEYDKNLIGTGWYGARYAGHPVVPHYPVEEDPDEDIFY